jgi:hypothetical protein
VSKQKPPAIQRAAAGSGKTNDHRPAMREVVVVVVVAALEAISSVAWYARLDCRQAAVRRPGLRSSSAKKSLT